MELPVKTSIKTSEVKEELHALLGAQYPQLGSEASKLRLREKSGDDKLTTVYHDCRELSRYHMYDGKEVAIQVLEHASEGDDSNAYLALVKEWNPATWEMSSLREVYVPKQATLADFGQILSKSFPHIPTAQLHCTKIASAWNFNRV